MKTNSTNNIWNKEDYKMCGLGSKNKFFAKIKQVKSLMINMEGLVKNYRQRKKKKEALDLLKEHFYALWD